MKKSFFFILSAFALFSCSKEMPLQPDITENPATEVGAANHEVGGRQLTTHLSGANEVPNPGDPDGTGMAHITVNIGQGSISYELSVSNIDPATAAHIHEAPAGVAGPVVIPLAAPASGSSSGTIMNLDRELLKDIIQNPENYYVNVHNPMYPGGAVRGQLSK
jgi:hypothetical protein